MSKRKSVFLAKISALAMTIVMGASLSGCYSPDDGYEAVDPGELARKGRGV